MSSLRRLSNVLLIVGVFGAARLAAQPLPLFTDEAPPEELAAAIVDVMTDREAVGQVLMFGYRDETPASEILQWITESGLGSVKIFGRNANNLDVLAETVGVYQQAALEGRFEIPLLIATDQEGGWVRHIRGASSQTAGNMALGAGKLPSDAYQTGLLLGRELAAVGVNMNFAPTIDVFVDPEADVIGPRAFMADPQMSGILGQAFANGHRDAGIIATAKHFPGHGDTSDDSHGTLPEVLADLDTLRDRDLVPYRTMIVGEVPAVMVGHLAFPTITGDLRPATLSYPLLTELLRDELGFGGVAITDDLFMTGARADGTPMDEVCYQAMLAGADLLLVSQNPSDHQAIHRKLMGAMADPAFNSRVRQAARRVIAMKAEWLRGDGAVPYIPETPVPVPTEGARIFFLSQAARAVTLVKDDLVPRPPASAGRVLLAGNYRDFFDQGTARYPEARTWRLDYQQTVLQYRLRGQELLRAARNYDTVVVLLTDEDMALIVDELEPIAEKVVIISALSPAHLDAVSWCRTAIAAYGTGADSMMAAFGALAGDFEPRGILPIPLHSDENR